MKATETLHDRGQSLWLDNITRDLLETGTLARYIAELSVTGLTSNPTIFDHAIKNSRSYDAAIRKKVGEGKSGEDLFFELALEDLTRAADLFRPTWAPWPRCSSAGGTRRSRTGSRRRYATSSGSRSPSGRTGRTVRCSTLRAGSASSTKAPALNACCGPARARRIPPRWTSSISRRSPHRS